MGNSTASSNAASTSNSSASTPVAIIDEEVLRGKIYEIRRQKVMLDFELAEIYGYSTKAFNQQVQRNIEKFDEDFMFQLTDEETAALSRSQIVTLNKKGRGSNFKYNPYAFTEQGIYMLMTVLKGELATRQSKALIRLFKRMKDSIIENQGLIGYREFLLLSEQTNNNLRDIIELRQSINRMDDKLAKVVDDLADTVSRSELSPVMMDFGNPAMRRGYFILNGSPCEANEAYAEIRLRA